MVLNQHLTVYQNQYQHMKKATNNRSHTNSRLKKSPTSSVVDGPPIFINTIAVGPFEDVPLWVTGGTDVATDRDWYMVPRCHSEAVDLPVKFKLEGSDALLQSWPIGVRHAILNYAQEE